MALDLHSNHEYSGGLAIMMENTCSFLLFRWALTRIGSDWETQSPNKAKEDCATHNS
jgi:hypothetical protein